MASFARVQDGVAVELFDAQPDLTPELMTTIRHCAGNVAAGWIRDGATFSPPARPPLAEVKAARKGEVGALYSQKLTRGMPYGGKVLQIEASQLRITGAAAAAGLTGGVPASGWRMADNSFLPMPDAAAMLALASAAAACVEGPRVAMWRHKDAIDAAADAAAVAACNIAAGW
jgi:hypothetical protein